MSDRLSLLDEAWCGKALASTASAQPILRDVGVEVQCSGAPSGHARFGFTVDGGRVTACALGAKKDADLVLKVSWGDLVAMFTDDLDPGVAFMTGAMKTDGPTGPLLALFGAWNRPAVRAARADLMAVTDLPS